MEFEKHVIFYNWVFNSVNVFKVHPCCSIYWHFILISNNITLHGYITVYPFIIWCTLGCFHVLAIMNNIAIYIYVQVFAWLYILLLLLSHMVTLYLTFWETASHSPKLLHHFPFPTALYEVFSCSLFLAFNWIFLLGHTRIKVYTLAQHYKVNTRTNNYKLVPFAGAF